MYGGFTLPNPPNLFWGQQNGMESLTVCCAPCDEKMYQALGFDACLGTIFAHTDEQLIQGRLLGKPGRRFSHSPLLVSTSAIPHNVYRLAFAGRTKLRNFKPLFSVSPHDGTGSLLS